MNKNCLLFTVLCFFSLAGISQIRLGIQGGLGLADHSLNWKDKDQEPDPDSRTGFNVGIVSEIPINEQLSFQPAILYSSKGFSGDNRFQYITNYVEVPLLIKYGFSDKFYGLVGPYIAIGVDAKIKSTLFDAELEFVTKEVGSDEALGKNFAERYDYGISVGFGYEFTSNLGVQLMYSRGINNINVDVFPVPGTSSGIDPGFNAFEFDADDQKAFNQVFSLSVVYFF